MKLTSIALLLAIGAPAWSAPSRQEISEINARISDVEGSLAGLRENFGNRNGLLGAGEARTRFDDSVVLYLVGDYEKAARGFFTLLESGALPSGEFRSDSQWYLGESLFEMESYVLAEEAYQAIVAEGYRHPLFGDAVRRLLELYGITGQADRFYSLYNSYVVTNTVKPNDLIVYTLAKSFYRQGDYLRAKSLFSDIDRESSLYPKARYFLATVRVVEGDLDEAIADFERVIEVAGEPDRDEYGEVIGMDEVTELAHLALGRIYYEREEFSLSTSHYSFVSRRSPHFSEALFEKVWGYIKQEDHSEALRTVQLFLLAFPEHKFTAELKLLQGNLQLILENNDSAMTTFEGVVAEYSPIQIELRELVADHDAAMTWFAHLTGEETGELESGLPKYAIDMLLANPDFGRASSAITDLVEQERFIEENEQLIADIDEALANNGRGLGSFKRANEQRTQVAAEAIRLQLDLLEIQERDLLALAGDSARVSLLELGSRRQRVEEAMSVVQDRSNQVSDQLQIFEDQIQAVQSRADRAGSEVREMLIEIDDLLYMLETGESPLWSERVSGVRNSLEELREQLVGQGERAAELGGATALRTIMAPLERSQGAYDIDEAYGVIRGEIAGLVSSYDRIGSAVDRSGSGEYSGAHQRLAVIASGLTEVGRSMAALENSELAVVRRRLEEERRRVLEARLSSERLDEEAEVISVAVTRKGLSDLEAIFTDQIMRADIGIVDVFWDEKLSIATEIEELLREQKEQRRLLNAQFERVYQVLGD